LKKEREPVADVLVNEVAGKGAFVRMSTEVFLSEKAGSVDWRRTNAPVFVTAACVTRALFVEAESRPAYFGEGSDIFARKEDDELDDEE